VAKTNRNSIFLDHEAHISYQVYIVVLYIIFMGFKKSDFDSNSTCVRLRFYQKCQFVAKFDWKSVFVGHEAHILDRLYIMVIDKKNLRVLKNQISAQNPKLTLSVFLKTQICAKNRSKLRISWLWNPHSGSVIHNGHV
jgi:hypothetical protein